MINEQITTYVSLESLSANLNLPKAYLKQLVANRLIPCLNVNGRLRFDIANVRQTLSDLAAKGSGNG